MKSIAAILVMLVVTYSGAHSEPLQVDVKKTATCGCCQAWINHLKQSGFNVTTENMALGALARFKRKYGVGAEHQSCHTGRVAGYTIEGHVPA